MSDQSMKDAAKGVAAFYDELVEQGFTGALLEQVVGGSAPIITSYVLYGHSTIGN